MLIDTHCHIHDTDTFRFALERQPISSKFIRKHPDFPHKSEDFTPEKMLARAKSAGVMQVICIGTSHEDSMKARDFADEHPGEVFWSYGIHPDESEAEISGSKGAEGHKLGRTALSVPSAPLQLEFPSPVAIGEVGLDYRNGEGTRNSQIKLFEQMIDLATKHDLPLIFHVREAFSDFFAVLDNFRGITGVVHSFSDSQENLQKSLEKGFFIGVNGLATFADIPLPPLERTLLETDAPFLTPKPFRGTINEAAHIKEICAYLSRVKGVSEQEMAQITTENARKLFRLQHSIV